MKTQINQSTNTNKTALRAGSTPPARYFQTQPKTKLEAAGALMKLKGFFGRQQLAVISEMRFGEEKQWLFDRLCELAELITSMPVTYETDGQGDAAIVQLHYFTSGCDWYITERDCEREQLQAFGLADLGYGGELGYISIVELLECGAELDLHWTLKTLAEVRRGREVEHALNDFSSVSSVHHY